MGVAQHSWRALLCAGASITLISVSSTTACAQASASDALIREGVQLRREGHDDQALSRFQRAWELDHSARARAQMGFAEQALGLWQLAEAHLVEARSADADPWIQQHVDLIERSLSVVRQHVPSAPVAPSDASDASVPVDAALAVTPPESAQPPPSPAATAPVAVTPPTAAAPHAPAHVEPGRSASPWRAIAIGAWVLGGVGVAAGAVSLGLRQGEVTTFNADSCTLYNESPLQTSGDACAARYLSAERLQTGAIVGFATGAAFALGGVIVWLLQPHTASTHAWGCAPSNGGIACATRF